MHNIDCEIADGLAGSSAAQKDQKVIRLGIEITIDTESIASPRARHAIVEADHAARRPGDVKAAEHDAGGSRRPNAELALATQEQERRRAIAQQLNMQLIDRHAV